jgi:hypothetical protein
VSNFGQTHGTAEKRQWLKLDEHIGHKATLIAQQDLQVTLLWASNGADPLLLK